MTVAEQTVNVVTPPSITATEMTVTPSRPCIVLTGTIDISVTWTNQGSADGEFIPNIAVNGISLTPAPYPSMMLIAGTSVTKLFTLSNLTVSGPCVISPIPN